MDRKLDDVVQALRFGKEQGRKCSLLIGAGCSVSAGIPSANGFVQLIQERFAPAYERASPKTYARCMAELPRGVQRDLIAREVDAAKINWGHAAIAQLMAAGYVDRVLTTNFDPLVVRACALSGVHPAVYDFAASQLLKPAQVPETAVFHLHGQRTGFVLMNTEEECAEHAKRLGPLFQDAGQGRIWLVVGYSGENDPVFDRLAEVTSFDYGLYWVGYRDAEPAAHVRDESLAGDKGAFFIKGFDADSFFVELAQPLDCFPPAYVERPFSHLATTLDALTIYKLPEGGAELDVTAKTRGLIGQARAMFEKPTGLADSEGPPSIDATELASVALMMAGKYREVQAIGEATGELSERMRDMVAWAYIGEADQLSERSEGGDREDADRLFALAGEKYQAALAIKPDQHEALNNWGTALLQNAAMKTGEEQTRLLDLAVERLSDGLARGWKQLLYNLACACALRGDEEAARRYLFAAQEHGVLPKKRHVEVDPDFAAFRDKAWFRELVDSLEDEVRQPAGEAAA